MVLAGCASAPPSSRDGPHASPPSGLDRTPDAVPRVEPIRAGGPNKPYVINGRRYVPVAQDRPLFERGLASWYGRKFHGQRTANGEVYDMHAMTAAHPTMPLPSYARVRNPANGREVIVRVNDRGPFHPGRIIDLSYTAALRLGVLRGVAPVEVERLTHEAIRTGAWRHDADAPRVAQSPAAAEHDGGASGDAAPKGSAPDAVTVPGPVLPVASGASTEPVAAAQTAAATAPAPAAAPGFWVQLGAFRDRAGAEGFARRVSAELDWLSPLLGVFHDASLYRLQAGPYASRDAAQDVAQRIRQGLQLVPLLIER